MIDKIDKWGQLIPDNLIECFNENELPVIFIGSGFGKEAVPPLKTSGELTAELRSELDVSDGGERLAELLQYLQNKSVGAKRNVVAWLKRHLLHGMSKPGGAHRLLLELPCREFLTTNYDSVLIQASREIRDYTLTAIDDAGSYESYVAGARSRDNEAVLARLHGAFECEDKIVATTDDYIHSFTDEKKWSDIVRTILRNRTVVFIGYSLRDFTTWTSYISIFSKWKGNMPPHVMVAPLSSPHVSKFWDGYGIQYVPLKASQFLIALHDRLGTLERDEQIALAAAAACLSKTYDATVSEIQQRQQEFGYSNLLMAALRIVED